MTQLSAERNTMELGAPRRVLVAGAQIYAGAMVAVKAADGQTDRIVGADGQAQTDNHLWNFRSDSVCGWDEQF